METAQRVVRKSALLSRLVTALVGASIALLCYSIWRENAPDRLTHSWPWKLRLLDIQSATTAVVGTLGASLARAQYARAVRPALGNFGRTMADVAPEGRLAWVCHVINGAQDIAVVEHMAYHVEFFPLDQRTVPSDSPRWTSSRETVRLIESCGLVNRTDFTLDFIAPGRPIPAQGLMLVGWFTQEAMHKIRTVYAEVRVIDRVGDTHERTVDLLKGANRAPLHPDAAPF